MIRTIEAGIFMTVADINNWIVLEKIDEKDIICIEAKVIDCVHKLVIYHFKKKK